MFGRQGISQPAASDNRHKPSSAGEPSSDPQLPTNYEARANWAPHSDQGSKLQPPVYLMSGSEPGEDFKLSLQTSMNCSRKDTEELRHTQHEVQTHDADSQADVRNDLKALETSCWDVPEGVLRESNKQQATPEASAGMEPFKDGCTDNYEAAVGASIEASREQALSNGICEQPRNDTRQFKLPAFQDRAKARQIQALKPTTAGIENRFLSSGEHFPQYRVCKIKDTYHSAAEYKRDCLLAVQEEIGLRHAFSARPNLKMTALQDPHKLIMLVLTSIC